MKVDELNTLADQERKYWRLRYELVENYLDISNIPSNHSLFVHNADRQEKLLEFQRANYKKLGLFKSEIPLKKDTVVSVVALRPKLYSLALLGDVISHEPREICKAKGVSRSVISNT